MGVCVGVDVYRSVLSDYLFNPTVSQPQLGVTKQSFFLSSFDGIYFIISFTEIANHFHLKKVFVFQLRCNVKVYGKKSGEKNNILFKFHQNHYCTGRNCI